MRENYNITIIDTIPFFDKKYTTLTIYAADAYLVPLRATMMDVYRIFKMLKELPKITKVDEEELYSKIDLVFNMVKKGTKQKKLVPAYADLFRRKLSSKIYIFENIIPNSISFSRIGTEDQTQEDVKKVKNLFEPFFNGFKEWFSSVADAREMFLPPEEAKREFEREIKKLDEILS